MSVPIAMVAGEASGDLLAGQVLGPLRERIPELASYGIGGPRMAAAGFHADWSIDKLSVMGYLEVLRNLPEILGIRRRLKEKLLASPPAAFVGVDAPDFNLGLEVALREAWRGQGRPVIHFVGPSIWAWRGERIETIRRAVDHMLVVLPFEEAIYREAGIPATYVGHPLADLIPMEPDRHAAHAALGLGDDEGAGRIVALLPGSRVAEIRYLAGSFVAAASILARRHPDVRFVMPAANSITRERFEKEWQRVAPDLSITIVDGRSHDVLAACDAALVASGTATLEAALFKRPMVIAYRVSGLSAFLFRRKSYLPWAGLPNILAREFVVPELLQDAATPTALADALEFQLCDVQNRSRLQERFTAMHHTLRRDTGRLAATVIADLIAGAASR